MASELLNSAGAAKDLGISVATLYEWLARSRTNEFLVRGRTFSINYFQGGSRGQGRIQIEASEIARLKEAMRVHPQQVPKRRQPAKQQQYPGITVPLGCPD